MMFMLRVAPNVVHMTLILTIPREGMFDDEYIHDMCMN